MKDKIVFITGATSGIGKETAMALSHMGATVVMTARNKERGMQTRAEIMSKTGREVHVIECDLASFDSIKQCVAEFKTRFSKLDVLINNAGVWHSTYNQSKDGIEETFAVNVLAPYLTTALLLDLLEAAGSARVISTSSGLHFGNINFGDIEYRKHFSGFQAYRQSKLAVILLTRYLAPKLKLRGISINCVHPGFVSTGLGRNGGKIMDSMFRFFGKGARKGAETLIYLASTGFSGNIMGEYFVNKKVRRTTKQSCDLQAAEKLVSVLHEKTGVQI